MNLSASYLDSLQINFILCTERTGSSMLSLMLNLHPNILSPSEEPFALYFWKKYRNKTNWNEEDLYHYVDSFFLIAEKNTDLYFSNRTEFLSNLLKCKEILNFERIVKITYLHFLDIKEKNEVSCIVDKQIKYFFHLDLLQRIFPSAKYVVLIRDVRDNVVSKSNRRLNWNQNPLFLAALWNDTYKNIDKLNEDKHLIISYESLIMNPKVVLKKVCAWFEIDYHSNMIETEGVFENLLEHKRNENNALFLKHLQNFHSGLSQKPNSNKIGQYKMVLSPKIIREIESLCVKTLIKFDYKIENNHFNVISLKFMCFKIIAKCYRRYLLFIYHQIPLTLKLKIKKWRGKNPDV